MPWLEPVTLSGPHARLEPLSHQHLDGLSEAVKDGELWKLWYTFIPRPEDMGKEIERRLYLQAAGSMLPFTVFDSNGRIAGMTTYMTSTPPTAASRLARPGMPGACSAARSTPSANCCCWRTLSTSLVA